MYIAVSRHVRERRLWLATPFLSERSLFLCQRALDWRMREACLLGSVLHQDQCSRHNTGWSVSLLDHSTPAKVQL